MEELLDKSIEVVEKRIDSEKNWIKALASWQINKLWPKVVPNLVKQGVPEKFRGEVWQKLSDCVKSGELIDKYRIIISKVFKKFLKLFCVKRLSNLSY